MKKSDKTSPKNIPWTEKYRPQSTGEMLGFNPITTKLKKFIEDFYRFDTQIKKLKTSLKNEKNELNKKKLRLKIKSSNAKFGTHKASLLIGPPGVGKTTVVYALAKDLNMSVIELNASDTRTKDALEEKLQETVKSTNILSFTRKTTIKKIILIDEVDGLHGRTDRGGVPTLKKIIGYSRFPIIMTCNFRDDQRFSSLYQIANPLIEINPANSKEIAHLLTQIAKLEKVIINEDQILEIASRCHGDFRAGINDLQALAQGSRKVDQDAIDGINMNRDSEIKVEDLMVNLFQADSIKEAKRVLDAVQSNQVDFNNIHKWINENLLVYISNKLELKFAFENLARADTILGYIGRTQDYQHLSYFFDILAGGIRFSKHGSKISKKPIRSPRWFRTRAVPDDEIALKIQDLYRVSLNNVMQEIRPNLKVFAKANSKIQEYLGSLLNIPAKKVLKEL
jgi:replication factor C large subunit